jgi:hypothetical protein
LVGNVTLNVVTEFRRLSKVHEVANGRFLGRIGLCRGGGLRLGFFGLLGRWRTSLVRSGSAWLMLHWFLLGARQGGLRANRSSDTKDGSNEGDSKFHLKISWFLSGAFQLQQTP